VEVGEVPRLALARELREELGIAVQVAGDAFAKIQGVDFRMDIWTIDQWTGEPSNYAPEEHDALAWLTDKELQGLRLADPRLPQLLHAALGGCLAADCLCVADRSSCGSSAREPIASRRPLAVPSTSNDAGCYLLEFSRWRSCCVRGSRRSS
jgi:8-oxo-dGTP diphosphatase